MARQTNAEPVQFTRAQLEYLEVLYPEVAYNVSTNPEEFKVRAIQRGVILNLRKRLAVSNKEF